MLILFIVVGGHNGTVLNKSGNIQFPEVTSFLKVKTGLSAFSGKESAVGAVPQF